MDEEGNLLPLVGPTAARRTETAEERGQLMAILILEENMEAQEAADFVEHIFFG